MKHYLTTAAAALFLLAAPATVFAQETGGTDNTGGQTQGGGDTTGAGAGTTNSNGNQSGTSDSNCPAMQPGQNIQSFSEKCRAEIDAWANNQTSASVVYEGDVAVGTVLPDTVEIVEVPAYHDYGYVMLNDRRVLVDRGTRTIVHVY